MSLPFPAEVIVASDEGIFLIADVADPVPLQLWDQPTAQAFLVGDHTVVSTGADQSTNTYPRRPTTPIRIFSADGIREIEAAEGEQLVLHDAALVDGTPVALATTTVGYGHGETVEKVVLIDLTSGLRATLGQVPGFEAGVQRARFVDNRVALLLVGLESWLEAWSLDGGVEWALDGPLGFDHGLHLTGRPGFVTVYRQRFLEPDWTPVIDVSEYRIDGGDLDAQRTLEYELVGITVDGGFCFTMEWAGGAWICDQTYGGPLVFESGGTVADYLGLDAGVPTLARR